MNNNELYHHGIIGMKWGVRRYQNSNGTLTKAGRRRYGADLDINDKSRVNIARIRKGEAYRRLDAARSEKIPNDNRIAELRRRVDSAKKAEKSMKKIDKGAKLAAKGQTIGGNTKKATTALVAASFGSKAFNNFLKTRVKDLESQGRLTRGHVEVVNALSRIGTNTVNGLAYAYASKKFNDNSNIRAYNAAKWNGSATIRSVGSSEYADVVKRRSK